MDGPDGADIHAGSPTGHLNQFCGRLEMYEFEVIFNNLEFDPSIVYSYHMAHTHYFKIIM